MAVYSKVFTAANEGVPLSSNADGGTAELVNLSYFTRAWIYQEIFLVGDRTLILCSRLCFSWEDFGRVICIRSQVTSRPLRGTGMRAASIMANILIGSMYGNISQPLDIGFALETMSGVNCGHPRKKVRAVLGAVDPPRIG